MCPSVSDAQWAPGPEACSLWHVPERGALSYSCTAPVSAPSWGQGLHIKTAVWRAAQLPICEESNSKLQFSFYFVFFFLYMALQGIIWIFCMRMVITSSRLAVGMTWSWFHSMSGWEQKYFWSNCQKWPLINTGTTETQFCRTCK